MDLIVMLKNLLNKIFPRHEINPLRLSDQDLVTIVANLADISEYETLHYAGYRVNQNVSYNELFNGSGRLHPSVRQELREAFYELEQKI